MIPLFSYHLGKQAGCLTKRAPDAGDSAAFSSSFLRLIIFLVGRLRRPRPSAGNANRWVLFEVEYPKINLYGGSNEHSSFSRMGTNYKCIG